MICAINSNARCAALFLMFIAMPAWPASAEPMGLEAGIEAKTARQRAKQAAERGAREEEQNKRNASEECGNLDIGNYQSNGSFNRVPREVTVVVQGDVINANNRCR